ncbi:MAG: DUF6644 family protein [Gammaproteobacteria bacterium]
MGFLTWYENTLGWLETTAIANAVRTIPWIYPTFESLHYVGLAFLVGSIMLIDLRTLGFARSLPLRSIIGLLPWVWAGFIINVSTGSIMFIYGATAFGLRWPFLMKMLCLLMAGLNALAFDLSTKRFGGHWVESDTPPLPVKVFATLSLILWLCVVTFGRWMAYV